MVLLDLTRPGQVVGGTDLREIDLTLYSQMLLTALEELDFLPGLGLTKSLRGGKGFRFPILGRTRPFRFKYGWNLEDSDNGGNNAVTYANAFRDIEVDDEPCMAYTRIPEADVLVHMDPDAYLRALALDQAQQLKIQRELLWLSTALQGAMHKTDLAVAGDNVSFQKSGAAQKVGLTDGANNDFGYHIDAAASGKAISDVLFLMHDYAKLLRWPAMGRWAILGFKQFSRLVQDIGLPVSYALPGGGSAVDKVPALMKDVMGSPEGSFVDVRMTRYAGFTLYDSPWLTGVAGTGLGTSIEQLAGVAAPATTDEKKYQPVQISAADMPQFRFQKVIQTVVQFGLASQPNVWTEFRDLYDKVWALFGCSPAVGTVELFGIRPEEGQFKAHLQATPLQAKRFDGMGIIRPECLAYAATAKATVA